MSTRVDPAIRDRTNSQPRAAGLPKLSQYKINFNSIKMREKKDLGDLGEKIAREYLEKKGYKILDKNFRYSNFGELDVVAQRGNPSSAKASAGGDIFFFEVKTRNKTGPGGFWPEDNITYDKQKKLIKLSQIWLSKFKLLDRSWQIDILAIEIYRDGSFDIRHTENAVGDMY